MSLHLALLIVYSLVIVGLGLWTARLVRGSGDFFVAGRRLGPGLVFTSMIAANIGAGSTVGAAGLAYRDGLSAWWWVGSAGLGSFVFAFWIAPRLWRLATAHNFYTTGDYLEFRYGTSVRCVAALLVGIGTLALLAGQLIAGAAILNVLTGIPRWAGALVGGAIMTIYFTAGGLVGSARVNILQLAVMLAGFSLALPIALQGVGGISALGGPAVPPFFADITYSAGPGSGWTLLVLLAPAFIISPGIIQKSWGARSEGALRTGIALNAAVLLLFAFAPVMLGMIARVAMPGIESRDAVLPMVLLEQLPAWLGALALAAVFSTEVDTCDAILFMISTSASQDFYKRFLAPQATDAQLLRMARLTAVAGGAIGILLAVVLETVIGALTIFYSLLVVTLFVPILGGLYTRRTGSREALAAIAAGVTAMFVVRLGLAGEYRWLDPTLAGLIAAAAAFAAVAASRATEARSHGVTETILDNVPPCLRVSVACNIEERMKTYRIAVIAGDGIGQEVIPAGIDVMKIAAERGNFRCEFTPFPWGCDFYLRNGRMADADAIEQVRGFDAIYLGAIGDPRVPDHVSARELILPFRQGFRQYVNLRPMRLLPGINSPLGGRTAADIDMICVRENSEGEYCGVGGRLHAGTADELAEQTGIFTRRGIERIARYAFTLAQTRPRKLLASATKSNALQHVMVFWDEVVADIAREFPDIEYRKYHVDALAARMITHPQTLDVIVASNMFGDILTDIGSAISGSLGVAPGGNINPERTAPSMFEPIHGSAPDIAGKGIANPIAAIWAGAMMLDHLGERAAHDAILGAIERVIGDERVKTPDLGGRATTAEMTKAVTAALTAGTRSKA